jgi:ABC-type bacteriocin/lantibiotic exporter with double-glycine peptidase domain
LPDLARAKRSGAVLFDIMEGKDEEQISLENGGTSSNYIQGCIEFKNISFKYPER